jgi:hypothetical protein
MSDTPRTDAAAYWHHTRAMVEVTSADFARTLERELATMTRQRDRHEQMAVANSLTTFAVGKERNALRADLEKARAEVTRLISEVVNRNKRALDGDQAIHVANKLIDDNDALRAEVERLRGALSLYRFDRDMTGQYGAEAALTPAEVTNT